MPIYDANGERISKKWKSYKTGITDHKGKPTSPQAKAIVAKNAIKHSFYAVGLANCEKCPYLDEEHRTKCPKYREMKEQVSGMGICWFEHDDLKQMYDKFTQDFELLESDKIVLKEMLYSFIALKRSRRYLSRHGLIQKQKIKDDKTGMVFDTESLNRVKKDMYYAEKNIREWLEQLSLARSSRNVTAQGLDLSLEIMKDGKFKKKIRL